MTCQFCIKDCLNCKTPILSEEEAVSEEIPFQRRVSLFLNPAICVTLHWGPLETEGFFSFCAFVGMLLPLSYGLTKPLLILASGFCFISKEGLPVKGLFI